MPWWAQLLTFIGAVSGTIATVVLGIQKARYDRATQKTQHARDDRADVIAYLTDDRNFWRAKCEKLEQEKAELQQQLNVVLKDADHATDVAQAALLAFRRGRDTA
jgi:uncharacterized membrane protein YgaE (UPF0421/DUF939 family)